MAIRRVLITGTTSGIGRSLLVHYASLGVEVISVSRRRDPKLESEYPHVRFECIDVRDADAVERLVQELSTSGTLPDAFILNAGINAIDNDESFDLAAYKAVLETNLYGVLHFVGPLTRVATQSGRCRVIAVSSLAGFVGNPYGIGYFTSKRALISCVDTWAKMYADTDLVFQQVILGPVPTGIMIMADRMPAWMVRTRNLFSGTLDGATQAIMDLAASGEKLRYYPRRALPLFLGMRVGQSLLPGFYQGQRTLSGSRRRNNTPKSR